jgi:hypothetical protein
LCGCASQKPQPVVSVPASIMPPLPTATRTVQARAMLSSVVVPPPAKMVKITPNYPVQLQVSTDMQTWLEFTNATTNGVTFAMDHPFQFYRGVRRVGTVGLMWSPSLDATVAGYKIYYGGSSHDYTVAVDVGNVTNCSLTVTVWPTNYFAATCYDAEGSESDFSNEAACSLPKAKLNIVQQ